MGKVIPLGCVTRLDLPPDRVLEAAMGKLEGVVLMGYDIDGNEFFSSTYADGGTVLWLMEQLKQRLINVQGPA